MEAIERETIITFNDADPYITVFTAQKRMMGKLEKMGAQAKERCNLGGKLRYVIYELPKDKVNVIVRMKRKVSSREIERMKKVRMLSPIGKRKESKNL